MDLATDTALPAFEAFAEPITFAGEESRGIPSTQLVEINGMVEKRMTVAVLVNEIPEIQKGQTVVIAGKSYRVDRPLDGQDGPDVVTRVMLR